MKNLMKNFCWLLIIICTSACTEEINWNGVYIYEADYGKNYADNSMIVTHTLTIGDGSCNLEEVGYQTWNVILCETKVSENVIRVNFKSYEDGLLKNQYGNAIYSVGDTLFSMTSDKGKIVTKWEKHHSSENSVKEGEMFIKVE